MLFTRLWRKSLRRRTMASSPSGSSAPRKRTKKGTAMEELKTELAELINIKYQRMALDFRQQLEELAGRLVPPAAAVTPTPEPGPAATPTTSGTTGIVSILSFFLAAGYLLFLSLFTAHDQTPTNAATNPTEKAADARTESGGTAANRGALLRELCRGGRRRRRRWWWFLFRHVGSVLGFGRGRLRGRGPGEKEPQEEEGRLLHRVDTEQKD
jgi:hypothetical protein